MSTFNPWPLAAFRTWLTTMEPREYGVVASWRSGSSSAHDDRRPCALVRIAETVEVDRLDRVEEGEAAAGHDAFLERCTRRLESVLDAVLLLLVSVSVAAPTVTTATPPASFARRSWSFSRSKSESVSSISDFSCLMRP